MNGISASLAIFACGVANTGGVAAQEVQLGYKDRIVMCPSGKN
ncbi:MAG: hypothetical protein KIH44_013510 [Octadecabacter sp.]|nr:hypothetical protein [Octadecabacter sp.]